MPDNPESSRRESMTGSIRYLSLRTESPNRQVDLAQQFFEQVYKEAFPKVDQSEGPDTWLPLLGEAVPDGQPHINIILAIGARNQIEGGVVFEEYRNSGCWLLTYLVVRPASRRQGLATGLMSEVFGMIGSLGLRSCSVLAEAENPARIINLSERATAVERLHILDRLGFRGLPIEYVQPALGPDKQPLDDLLLLCFSPVETPSRVPAGRIAAFLEEFYAALDQTNSPHLVQMLSMLPKQGDLLTERLASWI